MCKTTLEHVATKPKPRPRQWRSIVANWRTFAVTLAVSFFISPFLVSNLGDAVYGAWVLLNALVGYMGLLDLGVRNAVTRFIAQYAAEEDHESASKLASSALVAFLIAAILACVTSLGLVLFALPYFDIPSSETTAAKIAILVGGVTIGIMLINGVYEGILVGLQRFDHKGNLDVTIELLRAGLVVAAIKLGYGLAALAIIQLVLAILRVATTYWLSRSLYPELNIGFRTAHRNFLRTIFSFSVYNVAINASEQIGLYTSSMIISLTMPMSQLAYFAIGRNLTRQSRSIVTSISFTLMPKASQLVGERNATALSEIVLSGLRTASYVILPIVIIFLVRGDSFIGLWINPAYAQHSGLVLWILAWSLWADAPLEMIRAAMLGVDRHKVLVPVFVLDVVLNLALSIALAPYYGIIGIAAGATIPRLVFAWLGGPILAKRTFQIRPVDFWIHSLLWPSVVMIPFTLATYCCELYVPTTNLVQFFLQVVLTLPVAGASVWFLGMTQSERQRWVQSLGQRAT
jgi:O-antigen/teichoic acid export membrane protein